MNVFFRSMDVYLYHIDLLYHIGSNKEGRMIDPTNKFLAWPSRFCFIHSTNIESIIQHRVRQDSR